MRNMKTLLRLLGAVSLSTVAASSIVACGGGEEPKPDPIVDISEKITSPINLGELSTNTVVEFLVKL